MNVVNIKEPIWSDRSVGIAESKIGKDGVLINILYKNSMGEKVFPNKYFCSVGLAKRSKPMVRKGNKLRVVKIEDMELL